MNHSHAINRDKDRREIHNLEFGIASPAGQHAAGTGEDPKVNDESSDPVK